jgi:hypothetical protein
MPCSTPLLVRRFTSYRFEELPCSSVGLRDIDIALNESRSSDANESCELRVIATH